MVVVFVLLMLCGRILNIHITDGTGTKKRARERERVPSPMISVQLPQLFYLVMIVIIIIFRVHMVNGKYSYKKKEYKN